MAARLITPAVFAAVAGAVLALGTFGILQAGGPAEREEATVETRTYDESTSAGRRYDLVLRTASGERLETSGSDEYLDLRPGTPVRLEISEIGRSVQAIDVDGHRARTGNSPIGFGLFAVVFAAAPLLVTLAAVAETGRPVLATLSATAGLGAGALPVLLLF